MPQGSYQTLTEKWEAGRLPYEERNKQVGRMMKFIFPEWWHGADQYIYNSDQEIQKLRNDCINEYKYMAKNYGGFSIKKGDDNRPFRVDAQYILTESEWKLFQTTVGRVLRHYSAIHDTLLSSPSYRKGPYGAEAVEYYYYTDLRQAKFTKKFRDFDQDQLMISLGNAYAYGPSKGILIDGQTIAAARARGRPIVEDHAREAGAVVGIKEEMFLALGTGHYLWPDSEIIGGASGMNGLFNGAGNDLGANGGGIGGDDGMDAAGDLVHTLAEMYSKEKEDKFYGKGMTIPVICSSGILSGIALNANATRGTTEWETVREYLKEAAYQFKLVESHMIAEASAAPTTTTQEMLMIVPDPRGLQFIETRPLGDRITLQSKNPENVEFAVVGQGMIVAVDSKSLCKTTTLTTSTAW